MHPSEITVISVCYNSETVLQAMLESIDDDTPVILIDNASHDTARTKLLAKTYNATLIRNDTNLGFGTACNQGADAAQTPLLLFLNPDARLSAGATTAMLSAAKNYNQIVAFNPRLIDAAGRQYFKRRSKLMPRDEWMPRGWPDKDREVRILSGAALLVRSADFIAVGGFDENIFLYHEDDDLSRRLLKERGPLGFIRDAEIIHLEGSSNSRTPASARFKAYHMARSAIYTCRKHGRPFPGTFALFEATTNLISVQNLFSARKRAKSAGFMKGVLSMLTRKIP